LGPSAQAASSPAPAEPAGLARELLVAWVHLAVLWTFAVAKPLFDVLADEPEFFVARANTRADILVFSIGLVVIAPSLMVAVELALARLPPVRRGMHLLFVLGLSAAFILQLLEDAFGWSSALLIVGSGLLGLAAAFAYARTRVVPSILTVLGPAPLVFLLLFLLGSSVSKLILPQGAEAADADVRSEVPVVMVVFDEFDPNMLMDERERIDRTRYPNFAALADDATWYRNATTVNGSTTQAVPGLLASTHDTFERLPIASDYPDNLFTLVSESHDLNVVETATEICPESVCGSRAREPFVDRIGSLSEDLGIVSLHLLAPERMRSRLPAVDRTFGDFGGGADEAAPARAAGEVPGSSMRNRRQQFDRFLAGVEGASAGPSLHFLHVVLPHLPWEYMPTGQQYVNTGPDSPGLENEEWPPEPFYARLGLQRHLLQLGYVDTLVGRLVEAMRAAGIYERALVVLTADHGVSYRPGVSRRIPEPANRSDIAAVPLLVKYPGRSAGRVEDGMVDTLQIVPTVARELGTELPWDADGRPLGSEPVRPTIRVARSNGEAFEMPFEEFVQERREGLRRLISQFGAGDGGARLYANGMGAELLDRPVASVPAAADVQGEVVLDSAELLDDYERDSSVVPSYVTGRLAGDVAAGTPLAIAVNGRIAATTESFSEGDEVRIAGLVPPQAFRDGANTLEILAIETGGDRLRLASLDTQRPDTYRLLESDGELRIVGGGRTLRVDPGRVRGFVESAELNDRGLRVAGWAVDVQEQTPASRVLAFQGERSIAQGVPHLARPDVAGQFDSESVTRSGYDMGTSGTGVDPDELRVFAISGGVASELARLR
jgi:hypothetical protein